MDRTIDGSKPLENLQHELFVHEYLIDRHATAAYQRVYHKASYETARTEGPGLLAYPRIAARLVHLAQGVCKRLEINADRTLQELASVGFSRITDFVIIGPNGITIKDIESGTIDARAIASAEQGQSEHGTTIKIKLHNKVAALHDLAEHFGLFNGDGGVGKVRPVMVMNIHGTVVQVGGPPRPVLEATSRPTQSKRPIMTLPGQPEE